MIIDCDSCAVRGDACGDCVVAVLLGAPPDLQAEEYQALDVLAEAGLVPPLRLVEHSGDGAGASVSDRNSPSVTDPVHTATEPESEKSPSAGPPVTDDTPGRSTRAV